MEGVSSLIAFGAGLASFLSPCVLPLVPTYLTYLTGASLRELTDTREVAQLRRQVLANALTFVAGFALIFVLLGLSASAIGRLMLTYQVLLRKLGAAVIIVFGLLVMGVFKLPFLEQERRLQVKIRTPGPLNSLLIGMALSVGWTPCTGPILYSILMLAANQAHVWQAAWLLAVYSLGMGLPFLAAGLALGWFLKFTRQIRPYQPAIYFAAGLLLVIVGVLLWTNTFARLSAFAPALG